MGGTSATVLGVGSLVLVLALVYRPLGDYIARVFTGQRHLGVEHLLYRVMGVDPNAEQRWCVYLRSLLAFSVVSVLGLYGLQRIQSALPLSLGFPGVPPDQAFNTAVSFVTTTNWQSYSGESTMGHLVQMAGFAVQNFVSAAVGLAVAIALIRGFARSRTDRLGNFWVDLVRGLIRILLPIAFVGALLLAANGVVQNLLGPTEVAHTLAGPAQTIPGGPVASQEIIKELGTNGGGLFNANSAHPFENPNAFTNWLQILLILVVPFSLPRTFGRMVGDVRQGYALVAVMALLWFGAVVGATAIETAHPGTALEAAGASMEGKETRFGVPASALFATSTMTSTGAVNSFHSSYTALGGGITLVDMMLGEITPGGVGSGLYGILVVALLAVFLAGLMVGRTPEYLGKKVTAREIKLIALYLLVVPAVILVGTGLALALPTPRSSVLNSGAHGLTEVLYAFTSGANNNGSAFAGLNANTRFFNTAMGLAMLVGRFLPIVFVLTLRGRWPASSRFP